MLIEILKIKVIVVVISSLQFLPDSKGITCDNDQFLCTDGKSCILLSEFCDGFEDCGDNSDEPYRNFTTGYFQNETKFCRRNNHPQQTYICDLLPQLSNKTGSLCHESVKCDENQFSCAYGGECIASNWFCDGVNQCSDESDEPEDQEGLGRICDIVDWRNSKKECLLPQEFVCETARNKTNRIACEDGIDECACSDKSFIDAKCFRCLRSVKRVISVSKLCDGIFDCPDLSDECLCRNRPEVCHHMKWDEKSLPRLECDVPNKTSNMSTALICDGRKECANGLDERYCLRSTAPPNRRFYSQRPLQSLKRPQGGLNVHFEKHWSIPMLPDLKNLTDPNRVAYKCRRRDGDATRCDGTPECIFDIEGEECNCEEKPKFCNFTSRIGFRCNKTGDRLLGHKVCDGRADCKGMEDEESCPNRFYCGKNPIPNFPMTKRCDRVDDCDNEVDEANCPDHFYCKDGGIVKYLHKNKRCDGNQDCLEGSDETFCDSECFNSAFSNQKSMIKYEGVTALVFILGFIACTGNVIVTFLMIRLLMDLFKRGKCESKIAKLNAVLIMNLSISDLLVGIYILAIFGKSIQLEGSYCLSDREWSSSLTCSALGVLLVIGSEESVLTMVLIMMLRMRVILWPRSYLLLKPAFAIIILTWILSLAIALVPLAPSLEDYFVDSVWYGNNALFTTIERKEVDYLTNWLSTLSSKATVSDGASVWSKLEELIKNVDADVTVARKYGFYSTHAVCLPAFLPDRETDTAWSYSLFMILLNFIAFFAIGIGYIITFKRATKRNTAIGDESQAQVKRNKQDKELQRKLMRIVASDFLCWMPVCLMAFCSLAGVKIPEDSYLPIGLIIIPINSALNPFLYSKLPDIIWEKLSPQSTRCCLRLGNAFRGILGKSESTVEIELTDDNRQQVAEAQFIARQRKGQEVNTNVNPEAAKVNENVAGSGGKADCGGSNSEAIKQSQKKTVVVADVVDTDGKIAEIDEKEPVN